jgi:hypothetical protein
MKIGAAIAMLMLLTPSSALAQTATSTPIPAGAIAGPPYIETLPGERSNIRTVLVRFPSPVALSPDQACRSLNYDAGPKAWGLTPSGDIVWVICAWTP